VYNAKPALVRLFAPDCTSRLFTPKKLIRKLPRLRYAGNTVTRGILRKSQYFEVAKASGGGQKMRARLTW
jgi:hypothetical protein